LKKLIILLAVIFLSANPYVREFKKLTLQQQLFLYKVYKKSRKTKFKWSLVAIAWKESGAGIAMVNVFDGGKHDASCGPYHNLISSVFERHPEWVPSKFNKNKICTKLILDLNFATKESIAELSYWYKIRKGNWFKIWASYNGGIRYGKRAKRYAYDIYLRIRALKYIIGNYWENRFVKLPIH